MENINLILSQLSQTPFLLKELVDSIPQQIIKQRRIKNKWSIHEHVCHMAIVHDMMIKRFEKFRDEDNVVFVPYLPGKNEPVEQLIEMDLQKAITSFREKRAVMVSLLETFSPEIWNKKASHPEYTDFTTYIFARHILLHDHLHMYRIEELWITRDEYLPTEK